MRILPDNPSLDFLRREAKDLLAALRESQPATTLAEAQRALADQYGLRTWDDLRAEVDRRRADVPTPPADLGAALAAAFDLGTLACEPVAVSFDPMGRNWRLETERGRYLAGPVYPWMTHGQLALGESLASLARANGIDASVPIAGRDGNLVEQIGDPAWRVHEWADLGPIPTTPVLSRVAGRIGEIAATLHGIAPASTAPISPYLTYRRPGDDWLGLVDRARAAQLPWVDELMEFLAGVSTLRALEQPPAGPTILCNCNLIPDSVRTGPGDEVIVVEWSFAGSLTPQLELGYLLVQWVLRPALNPAALAAFAEGYRAVAGGLPAMDRSSFAVAISGWLNWAFNQICEAIDPEDDDRADFARREVLDLFKHPLTVQSIDAVLDGLAPYAVAPLPVT